MEISHRLPKASLLECRFHFDLDLRQHETAGRFHDSSHRCLCNGGARKLAMLLRMGEPCVRQRRQAVLCTGQTGG